MVSLLAFDTSTERMSLALSLGGRAWTHEAAGGKEASASLLPAILSLLERAGAGLDDLDAIAYGRGPGAFTGLRTACSVAQGLGLGAGKRVIGIDTLLGIAEDARAGRPQWQGWATLDARMDEIYAAHYGFADGRWQALVEPCLTAPEALNQRWQAESPRAVAGNALTAFAGRLQAGPAECSPQAGPRASALLWLAAQAWEQGLATDAADALPLYVRNQVAQTTAERARAAAEVQRVALAAARGTVDDAVPGTGR